MDDLKKWARDTNPNLRLSDGETVVVQYIGHKIVPDQFNPGKEKVQYEFILEGKTKYWANGSGKVAEFFADVKPKEWVKISATGEGMKRRYELETSIDDSGILTKQAKKDIEKELAG